MASPYSKKIQQEIEAAKTRAKEQSSDLWFGTRDILTDRKSILKDLTSRTDKMKMLTIAAFVISIMAAIVSHVTNTPEVIYAIIVIFVIVLGLWMQHNTKSLEHHMKSLEHFENIAGAANDLQRTVVHSKIFWE